MSRSRHDSGCHGGSALRALPWQAYRTAADHCASPGERPARRSRLASGSDGTSTAPGRCARCSAVGIPNVTVCVCSADNPARCLAAEVDFLMGLTERVVSWELSSRPPLADPPVRDGRPAVQLYPAVLKDAVESTPDCGTWRISRWRAGTASSGRWSRRCGGPCRTVGTHPAELADIVTQARHGRSARAVGRPARQSGWSGVVGWAVWRRLTRRSGRGIGRSG